MNKWIRHLLKAASHQVDVRTVENYDFDISNNRVE